MPTSPSRWQVETGWLADHLAAPDVVVLDGSMHLPTSGRDARAEYDGAHIPGATFFDIEETSDKSSPLPHMLPSPAAFAARAQELGIGDGTRVVVYDSEGLYSAARVWWMFRVMGHDDVAVLDGGLRKWRAEGRPLAGEPPARRERRRFTPRFRAELVRDWTAVQDLIGDAWTQLVDARSDQRFHGTVPEPRAGLRSGHIPSARNVPFEALVRADGTLRPVGELRAIFRSAGVDEGRPVVASCGSGVTAAVVAFALAQMGHPDTAIYDGSWTEWGGRQDLPLETA